MALTAKTITSPRYRDGRVISHGGSFGGDKYSNGYDLPSRDAVGEYDSTIDGALATGARVGTGIFLPRGAFVLSSAVLCTTTFTGTATDVVLSLENDGDLFTENIAELEATNYLKDNTTGIVTTEAREVILSGASGTITAGRLIFAIQYVVLEPLVLGSVMGAD